MENNKYKYCSEVTREECYVGGKNCGTCMYRDNLRTKDGFRKSEVETGIPDWCRAVKRKVNN